MFFRMALKGCLMAFNRFAAALGALAVACAGSALAADLTAKDIAHSLFQSKNGKPINFGGKSLAGLDLAGLDFSGARLAGSDLIGADLSDADLTGADLEGANLSDVIFCRTVMDDGTTNNAGCP